MEVNATTVVEIDPNKEVLDISSQVSKQGGEELANNPIIGVKGQLMTDNSMDYYFFSVTDSKFMLARLLSNNLDYAAQLYMVNYETDEATPTNIYGFAGNLMAVSSVGSVGDEYSFYINATNPSGSVKKQLVFLVI